MTLKGNINLDEFMQTINELIMIKTKRSHRLGTELRGSVLAYHAKGSEL